jgi:hypothetical protein
MCVTLHTGKALSLQDSGMLKKAVLFRIRIRKFWGLPDPKPDPLVGGMDPDPSIIKQK